jgi:hypothetical protein
MTEYWHAFVRRDLEKTGISAPQYLPEAAGLIMCGGEAAHVPDGLNQTIRHRVGAGPSALEAALQAGRQWNCR